MNKIGPGSLKCVVCAGGIDALLEALLERMTPQDIRRIGREVALVYTPLEAAELRDWLARRGRAGAALLVVEFEKWSSYGDEVDREWLLARGH